MKTAIYIEDGVVQLVITPETEFEKNSLSMFREKPLDAKLFNGTFYDCRGGWVRQTALQNQGHYYSSELQDCSLILRVEESSNEPTL